MKQLILIMILAVSAYCVDTKLTISNGYTTTQMKDWLQMDNSNDDLFIQKLESFAKELKYGIRNSSIELEFDEDATAASGTFTFASAVEDDTAVIGGVTFTAKDSPSGAVQFAVDADGDQTVANFVAAVNAHTTVGAWVILSQAASVATATCKVKGVICNAIATSATGNITAGAAALAGGVDAGVRSYNYGY